MPAVRLNPPVERSFIMVKTNALYGAPDADTSLTIKQATQGDHERIADLSAEYKRIYGVDEGKDTTTVVQKFNFAKLQRHQAMCTIKSCTLENADGSLLFGPECLRDAKKFENAWSILPPEVVDEIMEFVYQVNPSWDPNQGE